MSEHEEEMDAQEAAEAAGLPGLATGEVAPTGQESLLDQLRAKREEVAGSNTCFIPIPGYDGDPPVMMAQYRVLDGKELDNIGRKVARETKDRWDRNVLAAMDVLIACCQGMYVDMQNGAEPQQMTLNGVPIAGYNQDLAQALQFQAETARQVVMGIFVNNEVALMQHNVRLSMWMGNTSRRIDEDVFAAGEV